MQVCLANQIRETKYRRLDDGSQCDYAELEVRSEELFNSGRPLLSCRSMKESIA